MNTIITIGREFGSGGHEIGATLAHDLGLKLYDKEMLKRAAKESGLCEELFETHDEKPTNSFLYSLVMDTYSLGYSSSSFADMPINHKVFLAQFDTIKKIADELQIVILLVHHTRKQGDKDPLQMQVRLYSLELKESKESQCR